MFLLYLCLPGGCIDASTVAWWLPSQRQGLEEAATYKHQLGLQGIFGVIFDVVFSADCIVISTETLSGTKYDVIHQLKWCQT